MEEHIEFKNIETPEAVKGFRELIEEKKEGRYQTIFLNGKWGSGKTTFLEKASDSLEKTSELNKKVINLFTLNCGKLGTREL